MILKKIKTLIKEFRIRDESLKLQIEDLKLQNSELEWAHIYHDTIKDKIWLKDLAVSPGRWAVGYSFLYILARILSDYKPKRILEFGLGESTKVISSFLENNLVNSKHCILEQDSEWVNIFNSRFSLSPNSELIYLPLVTKEIKGYHVNSYDGIEEKVNGVFDLYVVDGPFGSAHFSRYDICKIIEELEPCNEFIIIIDDYNREGEKQTVKEIIKTFEKKGIKIYTGIYTGTKSQIILATEKYRFSISM